MSSWIEPVRLAGNHATLEPLSQTHKPDLEHAVQNGQLWKLWFTSVPEPQRMAEEIDRRNRLLEKGAMLPFAVIGPDGKAVGMTTLMHIDARYKRVEIGATWYAKRVQRSPVNTECKMMLLAHAFETLECIAVEFRTSFFNQRSRRAIERLGAKLDGVLRNHQRHSDGTLRDTCVYSIISSEWPTVQRHLRSKLESHS